MKAAERPRFPSEVCGEATGALLKNTRDIRGAIE